MKQSMTQVGSRAPKGCRRIDRLHNFTQVLNVGCEFIKHAKKNVFRFVEIFFFYYFYFVKLMEQAIRDRLDEHMEWILQQEDPFRAAARVFADRTRGKRPMRQGVDLNERRNDMVEFVRDNFTFSPDDSVSFDEFKTAFETHRKKTRKSRVSWNTSFHIDAFSELGIVLTSDATDGYVQGIAWKSTTDKPTS